MQIVTAFSSVDSANARYLRAKKMGSASYTKHRSARRGVSWLSGLPQQSMSHDGSKAIFIDFRTLSFGLTALRILAKT